MTLTDEQKALLPTNDDVAFYREHGYYVSNILFTDSELDAALEGTDRFYAGDLDGPFGPIPDAWKPKGPPYDGLRKHDFASFFCQPLTHLIRESLIGAVAARLTGSPSIRLWHDQLLWKPTEEDPNKPANVGWHTDRGYWKTCSSEAMLTAWIPFHDCDETMGTITMMDASHLWPDNTEGLNFFSSDLEGLEKKINTGGRPMTKIPINLKRGQVSFHNCLTIHGSGPNRSDRPRRSIAVHLQDEANQYRVVHHSDGTLAHHSLDDLCRKKEAQPDYTDPAVCPTVFP